MNSDLRLGEHHDPRLDAKSMSLQELETFMVEVLGEKQGRGLAVYKWMWQRGATSFAEMEGITRSLQSRLAERMFIPFLDPSLVLRSNDGAVKYLWKLDDGHTIESVLIPDDDRVTLCMSSQVGCAMACTFCLTGDMGLKRHMVPSEIANQPLQVGRLLPPGQRITNLVLMGMGEPLHNLDNLVTALEICLDDHALNYSHRKVTVSTVGLVPKLGELAAALPVNLAVSLNATTNEFRRRVMPITKRYSLEELLQACRDFSLPNGKRITFEYVMFAGLNDTIEDAERLVGLLQGIPAKVNLIPYNENPDQTFRAPDPATVQAFQSCILQRGLACHVRTTRGLDISAACGQLGQLASDASSPEIAARSVEDPASP